MYINLNEATQWTDQRDNLFTYRHRVGARREKWKGKWKEKGCFSLSTKVYLSTQPSKVLQAVKPNEENFLRYQIHIFIFNYSDAFSCL